MAVLIAPPIDTVVSILTSLLKPLLVSECKIADENTSLLSDRNQIQVKAGQLITGLDTVEVLGVFVGTDHFNPAV